MYTKLEKVEFKITRPDASTIAVVESRLFNGKKFFRVRVVEDSDWLSHEDMMRLFNQGFNIILNPPQGFAVSTD
jgi:hypothetical protein